MYFLCGNSYEGRELFSPGHNRTPLLFPGALNSDNFLSTPGAAGDYLQPNNVINSVSQPTVSVATVIFYLAQSSLWWMHNT